MFKGKQSPESKNVISAMIYSMKRNGVKLRFCHYGIVKKSAVEKHPKFQETQSAAFFEVERSGTEKNAARQPVKPPAVPLPTPGI